MVPTHGEDADLDRPDLTRLAAAPATRPSDAVRAFVLDLGLTVRSATVTLVAVVAVIVGAWWWWHDPPPSGAEASIPLAQPLDPAASATAPAGDDPATGEVVAHAAGAVRVPGVYTLAAGARISDLIDAAGGAGPRADLDRVNLAATVGDGAQVYVPELGEATPSPAGGDPGAGAGSSGTVDVNTAGADALETLPGIGPATSAAIIAYREEHGAFATVDELIEVPGIGEAKLAAIRDLVSV